VIQPGPDSRLGRLRPSDGSTGPSFDERTVMKKKKPVEYKVPEGWRKVPTGSTVQVGDRVSCRPFKERWHDVAEFYDLGDVVGNGGRIRGYSKGTVVVAIRRRKVTDVLSKLVFEMEPI
jgi:hypothetical protein